MHRKYPDTLRHELPSTSGGADRRRRWGAVAGPSSVERSGESPSTKSRLTMRRSSHPCASLCRPPSVIPPRHSTSHLAPMVLSPQTMSRVSSIILAPRTVEETRLLQHERLERSYWHWTMTRPRSGNKASFGAITTPFSMSLPCVFYSHGCILISLVPDTSTMRSMVQLPSLRAIHGN